MWGRLAGVTAGAVCLLLVGVSGAGAASSTPVDGLWWYDAAHIGDAVASGATGAGVKVAVIDAAISPQVPVLVGADVRVHEPSYCKVDSSASAASAPAAVADWSAETSHGTNVVSMIVGTGRGTAGSKAASGVAPKATVLFYSHSLSGAGDAKHTIVCPGNGGNKDVSAAIVQAVDDGARILSLSFGTAGSTDLSQAVAWAQHQGVIVVAALPNSVVDGTSTFDTMNGVVSVEGVGPDLKPAMQTDGVQGHIDVLAPGAQLLLQGNETTRSWQDTEIGQGNSFATPFVAGVLAAVWSKYPKATGNQLLQSLVRNTGAQDHALDFDDANGYGVVSEAHMLRVDPTQYPDVNPLLTENGYKDFASMGSDFTAAQVASATRPSWAPPLAGTSATASPAPSAAAASPVAPGAASSVTASSSRVLWWVLGGAALVLVLVLVLVLNRGRARAPEAAPAPR